MTLLQAAKPPPAPCPCPPLSLVSLNETTPELMAVFVREPVFVFGRQGNRPVPQSLASSALHQCACMFTSQLAPLAMSAAAGRTMYVAGSTISSQERKYRPTPGSPGNTVHVYVDRLHLHYYIPVSAKLAHALACFYIFLFRPSAWFTTTN